jgi:hypothetical protein
LISFIPGTIIPWLLGGLLALVLLTLSITLKAWREAKRSPYFFLRIQAAKQMQRYALITLGLIVLTLATTAYAWQVPEDPSPRSALIKHAKGPLPAGLDQRAPAGAGLDSGEAAAPERIEVSMSPASGAELEIVSVPLAAQETDLVTQRPRLPAQFDQLEPTAAIAPDTRIGELSFSTEITGNYEPVAPDRRFINGYFTLYATFAYEGMKDGMVWSWVWRHNGEVLDGGNQVWSYGDEGPGYIYLRPEEGFGLGSYVLEIWVNRELMGQANFVVGDGVAANQ